MRRKILREVKSALISLGCTKIGQAFFLDFREVRIVFTVFVSTLTLHPYIRFGVWIDVGETPRPALVHKCHIYGEVDDFCRSSDVVVKAIEAEDYAMWEAIRSQFIDEIRSELLPLANVSALKDALAQGRFKNFMVLVKAREILAAR